MQSRQDRTVNAFENVLQFLAHADISPEPVLLQRKREELKNVKLRLEELRARQVVLSPKGMRTARELSQRLRRDKLMPLVRIVKPLMKFAPGAERVLKVPHARADLLTVATTALEMAKLLKPHADLLRSAGFPKNFLSELEEDARRLTTTGRASESGRQARSRLAMDIANEIKEGMKTVTVIEGIVMLHSPGLLKHWKERRRVPRRIGRPKQKRKSKPA